MSPIRASQKTKFTPAFVAGVLFFAGSVAIVVWFITAVAAWVQDQQNAPIKRVEVYGEFSHIKADEIHRQLNQQLVGNFFNVEVDSLQAFLQQQPWVYQVAVRKQWPGKLVVVVTEHRPVAIWNSNFLLNKRGEVFKAPLAELEQPLPHLNGPAGSEEDALAMYSKVQSLLALHQMAAQSLTVNERFAWEVQLNNGIALKLGREDTLKRVQRFIDLYPVISKQKPEAIEQVDLRYDTGLAVRYAQPVITEKSKA